MVIINTRNTFCQILVFSLLFYDSIIGDKKVKSLGYPDDLEKEYDDPISHFSLLAKEMTKEAKNKELPLDFNFPPNETIAPSTILRKDLGFSVLSYFYHKFER